MKGGGKRDRSDSIKHAVEGKLILFAAIKRL